MRQQIILLVCLCFLFFGCLGTEESSGTLDEVVDSCRRLQEDAAIYEEFAEKAYEFSLDYHIDNISSQYLNLVNRNVGSL